ncbi:MAG: serine/threonine-protein phosphatase, partial [Desulfobacterales bacterium]|nr:serine/threonine-protein phosphatase [Desulfobacterales bacterium]
GMTHVGRKRKENEDAFLLDDELGLYIVADGMGGSRAGDVASGLVVKTLRDYMRRSLTGDGADALADSADKVTREANRLLEGIRQSNRKIHEVSQHIESFHGMGSTVSALQVAEDAIVAANVGDSPIYLVHGERIGLVSVTHTVFSEHAALYPDDGLTMGEEFKHILTRAMGVEAAVKADISLVRCFHDDLLVIGSDGLSGKVAPGEILREVRAQPPEEACESLVALANQRGGEDNITVVVLKIIKEEETSSGFRGLMKRTIGRLF